MISTKKRNGFVTTMHFQIHYTAYQQTSDDKQKSNDNPTECSEKRNTLLALHTQKHTTYSPPTFYSFVLDISKFLSILKKLIGSYNLPSKRDISRNQVLPTFVNDMLHNPVHICQDALMSVLISFELIYVAGDSATKKESPLRSSLVIKAKYRFKTP